MIGERNMNTRQGIHKAHAKTLGTQQLREEFLVESIFEADSYTMTYSHIDRIRFGSVGQFDVQQQSD